jgi:hypothetical protein
MSNDKLKQLIDAFSSLDYDILKINYSFKRKYCYGDVEILLRPVPNEKYSFSKDKTIRLFEKLFSLGYGIVTFDLISFEALGDFRLVLQTITSLPDIHRVY